MRHGCARAAVGRPVGQRLLANENGGLWITPWVAVLFVGRGLEQPGFLDGEPACVRLDAAANGVALWSFTLKLDILPQTKFQPREEKPATKTEAAE